MSDVPVIAKAVRCDDCGTLFEIHLVEDPDGLQWFSCAKCGRVYEVLRVSVKGREIRAKMQRLRRDYAGAVGPEAIKIYRRLKQLEKQMRREVTKLCGGAGAKV